MSAARMSQAPSKVQFQRGGLRIAGLLEVRPRSDRLTVVLNAYCARHMQSPPVFAEWPESSDTFGHILRISDPSLFLSDWINASCFLGTEAEDPIPAVVECSKQIAHKLGVSENRVVYFGHSGAGFGAIQCAIFDGASSGLAVNPILEPEQYAKYNFAQAMAAIFRPHANFDELYKDYPERLSVIRSVKTARASGLQPCLGVIQNILDTHHYGKHFMPFCKSVGISPVGGVDATGLIQGMTCILRGGHSAFPKGGLTERLFLKLLFLRSQGADDRRAANL